jgi:hypothetical protein
MAFGAAAALGSTSSLRSASPTPSRRQVRAQPRAPAAVLEPGVPRQLITADELRTFCLSDTKAAFEYDELRLLVLRKKDPILDGFVDGLCAGQTIKGALTFPSAFSHCAG